MDALDAIATRHSVAPPFLGEPAPDGSQLRQILAAGAAAPDHGRLRPWRFVVVRGEARRRLGEVFAAALEQRQPEPPPQALEQERQRPLRAPLVVAVIGRIDREQTKIPEVEQILSVGAAAQNILLAAHALGFGGKWLTGANAYDPEVRHALGAGPDDVLAGFLHLGTVKRAPPAVPHAEPQDHTMEWRGASDLRPLPAGG